MKRFQALAALSLAASCVLVAGCNEDRRFGTFDPRALAKPNREAAAQQPALVPQPLPTNLNSKYLPEQFRKGPAPTEDDLAYRIANGAKQIKLPLREVCQRAVANNLNVKVSGYQPAIDETRVTEAEARFDPVFFVSPSFTANRNTQFRFAGERSDVWSLEIGLKQNLYTGGQIKASFAPSQAYSYPGSFSAGSAWQNQATIELTQPLLRDFGLDVNRARIVINKNNQRISVLEFRKDLEEALRNIEEVYWRLVQAQRNVSIQQELLSRTMQTAEILNKRFPQDVTMEQIAQALQSIKQRKQDRLDALQRVADLSDQLKNLMNDPEFPVTAPIVILPADNLLEKPVQFDFSDLVSSGVVNRFEVGQQQLRIENAKTAANVAVNNLLPQLNFVGSIGLQRVGPDAFGEGGAFDNNQNLNWKVGLDFELPIGNREAEAIYRRADLQLMQAITSYKQLVDQVSTEVSVAHRGVATSWEKIGLAREARFAAEERLKSIETRERANEPLTPDFVDRKLRAQEGLAQAEQSEVETIADYNIAISRLESAKGTLLRYNNIVLDEKTMTAK